MDVEQSQRCLGELTNILIRLAAPASHQVEYLRKMNVLPLVDELALEFYDLVLLIPQLIANSGLTQEQGANVYAVDRKLGEMSERKDLWRVESLTRAPHWDEVRKLAGVAIEMISPRRTH